jgi:hypothetical protein
VSLPLGGYTHSLFAKKYDEEGGLTGLNIVSYDSAEHRQAVQRLNAKLAAADSEFRFPICEPFRGTGVSFEHFVAIEAGEVYGGYLLKHQKFSLNGSPLDLGNMQLLLSLGLFDKKYSHVSAALLFDALERNELLYCLGMGSQDSRIVRMLTAAGWRHRVVPFYFSIKSGNEFARNIRLPADKAWLQNLLRISGWARLAGFGLWAYSAFRTRGRATLPADTSFEEVPRFDRSADALFEEHACSYALVGDRRSAALTDWYPETNRNFHRLLIKRGQQIIGWALVVNTRMENDKYFGNLRVGTLADCFALPCNALAVAAAADHFLSEARVDLIVSNQLHPVWGDALCQLGYSQGLSNFFLYFSEELARRLEPIAHADHGMHFNRGDGDGPIHL